MALPRGTGSPPVAATTTERGSKRLGEVVPCRGDDGVAIAIKQDETAFRIHDRGVILPLPSPDSALTHHPQHDEARVSFTERTN